MRKKGADGLNRQEKQEEDEERRQKQKCTESKQREENEKSEGRKEREQHQAKREGKQSIGICRNQGGIWTKKRRRKGRRRGRKWNKHASYTMLQTRTDELNINICYKGSMRACSFVNFCAYGGITSPFKISCSESFHLW